MRARAVLLFSVLAATAAGAVLSGQKSPEATAAGLKPAPGLEATLFAAEPMVMNPTNLAVDERGRVWVLEGVNYRRAARKLPDLRPEGDRIIILEDTDLDGKADKVKVFDQSPSLRVPLGIAVFGDKVVVSQSPDIIVYTKDAEDRIVKKDVLLTGWGGADHDHGVHAIVFGPDGRYYFNQGNTGFDLTDRSGKRLVSQITGAETRAGYYQGVVVRMNEDGTGLDVIAQNFRNPYELAIDSFGNMFQTDNDDDGNAWTRLDYVMAGGNYGYRGPRHRTFLEDGGTHWHLEAPGVVPQVERLGAGSPCGVFFYEGTLLPERFRGQFFHAEAGRRVVEMYPLTDDGAGFKGTKADLVNMGDDTWARPCDATVAPDGSVYVADWYDPGVGGHQMGDPEGKSGRVYRVAPIGHRPQVPKLDLNSTAGLTAALRSPNDTIKYLSYTAIEARGQGALPLLQAAWSGTDPILKARALWLLGPLGAPGNAAIQQALRDPDPRFRILGLRVARETGASVLDVAKPLLADRSPQVRREILVMLQDSSRMLPAYGYPPQVQPTPAWLDAVAQLSSQHDGKDRWYLEAIGIAARGREEALYARLESRRAAMSDAAFNQIVWRLRPKTALPDLLAVMNDATSPVAARQAALDTVGWMEWPEAASVMETFMTAPATPPALVEHAFGLYSHQLMSQWMESRTSAALPAVMRKALTLPGAQAAAVGVADALADPQYRPDLLALAKSGGATPAARAAALDSIATTKDVQYLREFQALADNAPTPVRVAAIRAIGGLAQPGVEAWAQELLSSDAPNEVRVQALRLLGTSVPGLNAILDLAEAGRIPAELLAVARRITNSAAPPPAAGRRGAGQSPVAMRAAPTAPTDPAYVAIRARAAKVLAMPGTVIPTAFQLDLNYGGRAAEGRKVYDTDAACAACHSLGDGRRTLGPDLSKIGEKYGKQAMLDDILNPNGAIGPEYITTVFTMKNGSSVSGLITGETATEVTIAVGTESQRLAKSEIASRRPVQVSSMPEGLLSNLSLQQIADLLEFLSTLK
ncbi:MAG: c-type cytochrome [Acidobacteria bacterium]|nr:c-type cytochrome [Acidobacteriota bacterium]